MIVVSEDHMLKWHSCQICYSHKMKLLLLLLLQKMLFIRIKGTSLKYIRVMVPTLCKSAYFA